MTVGLKALGHDVAMTGDLCGDYSMKKSRC